MMFQWSLFIGLMIDKFKTITEDIDPMIRRQMGP
jgi:hypothetical protein